MYIRQSALCGLTAHIRDRYAALEKKPTIKTNRENENGYP